VRNANGQILNGFFQKLIFDDWIVGCCEASLDDVESEVEVGFGFVGDEADGVFDGVAAVLGEGLVDSHHQLVVGLGEVVHREGKVLTELLVVSVFFLGLASVILAQLAVSFIQMY
jgi:hypothetical protein